MLGIPFQHGCKMCRGDGGGFERRWLLVRSLVRCRNGIEEREPKTLNPKRDGASSST
jgi:hypothetical protein